MKSDILWLPPEEPFSEDSYVENLLQFDAPIDADDATFKAMLALNQGALDFVEGRLDTGTYLDMLDEFGVEPEEFLHNIETKVGL